jgi:hypothetical protein
MEAKCRDSSLEAALCWNDRVEMEAKCFKLSGDSSLAAARASILKCPIWLYGDWLHCTALHCTALHCTALHGGAAGAAAICNHYHWISIVAPRRVKSCECNRTVSVVSVAILVNSYCCLETGKKFLGVK